MQLGEKEEAIKVLTKATQVDPSAECAHRELKNIHSS